MPETTRKPNRLLQFFKYEHLRPDLQEVSKPFGELALNAARQRREDRGA